jgi:UDP-glucose 4-epimerase
MKYLVTGGAGFIGSHIVDMLLEEGHNVHVIDNFSTGKKENCNKNAYYHEYDIADIEKREKFIEIMNNVDTVFHTAALARVQPSIKNPLKYELNNTIGLMNMLKTATDANVKRFVYSASSSAYGNPLSLPSKESYEANPISPYAAQKYYGEICCKMFSEVYNIETVSLRYFNVYGERQHLGGSYATVIGIFIKQCIDNEPMTINGDGEQRRDFTYVKDVAKANLLASQSKKIGDGEIINIGSGINKSVNEIAEMIGRNKIFVNAVKEPREGLADRSKAKELLGWEPKIKIEDWIASYKKTLGL